MSVTLTKEFWTNLVLFVVACVALGLSIWAFVKPCKKDKFGDGFKINGNIEYGKLQNDDDECIVQYANICNKSCFKCNQNYICPKDKTCKEGEFTPGKGTCVASGQRIKEVICGN